MYESNPLLLTLRKLNSRQDWPERLKHQLTTAAQWQPKLRSREICYTWNTSSARVYFPRYTDIFKNSTELIQLSHYYLKALLCCRCFSSGLCTRAHANGDRNSVKERWRSLFWITNTTQILGEFTASLTLPVCTTVVRDLARQMLMQVLPLQK